MNKKENIDVTELRKLRIFAATLVICMVALFCIVLPRIDTKNTSISHYRKW